MAATSTRISPQSVLLAKIESTTGTPETLADADGMFNVFSPSLEPDVMMTDREGQSSLDQLTGTAGARSGTFTFETELFNSGTGTVPAWATTFLPACGMSNSSGTFTFVTGASTAPTLTMGLYEDGGKRFLSGAMGTWVATYQVGKPIRLKWTFKGLYQTEADATLPTPSYPISTVPPVFQGSTISVHSFAPVLSQIVIDAGNNVVLREDAGNSLGWRSAVITGRKTTATLDPEAALVATQDWYGKLIANTEASFSVAVGSGTNGIVTASGTKFQITKKGRGNRNGILIDQLEGKFNRATAAGDDAFSLVFS